MEERLLLPTMFKSSTAIDELSEQERIDLSLGAHPGDTDEKVPRVMSWSGTFTHGVAIALDVALDRLWFWRDKTTMRMSSRCHQALCDKRPGFLSWLGRQLNRLDKGPPVHTLASVKQDLQEAGNTMVELTSYNHPPPEA